MRKITCVICVFVVISFSSLSAQIKLGIGSGLYISQSYKNNPNVGTHSYVYSDALDLAASIGIRRKRFQTTIQFDYASIPKKFEIKTPFFTNPEYRFKRKSLSSSINFMYFPSENLGVSIGAGALFSDKGDLNYYLNNKDVTVVDPVIFSNKSISSFISLGLSKSIKLSENIELIPRVEMRRVLNNLYASYQSIDVSFGRNTVNFRDILYIESGNAFTLNIFLVYKLKSFANH